ncbi:hypothetical protein MMC09_006068 [Bachmanniomyces sp. S44760]|nr:hypothetical protein [Bachmanniomyces sp. S44760]
MVSPSAWSTAPTDYHQVVEQHQRECDASIASGQYVPFVWPYRSFGLFIVFFYLLLPPSQSIILQRTRFIVFAINAYFSISAIRECRSSAVSVGYGIGLINAWSILWSSVLLVFNDARTDFKRIEKRTIVERDQKEQSSPSPAAASIDGKSTALSNGSTDFQDLHGRHANGSASSKDSPSKGTDSDQPEYVWQPLPNHLLLRLDWVTDLVCNFRGTGWSHAVSSIPKPPPHVHSSLTNSEQSPSASTSSGVTRYSTHTSLYRTKIPTFIFGYMGLDILKSLLMSDPYFFLPLSPSFPRPSLSTSPPAYLKTYLPLLASTPWALKLYRLTLTLSGTYTALQTIFVLGPLLLTTPPLRPILGLRSESWHYPDTYGSYASSVFAKGLAGWWGGWWHQTFRLAFQSPTTHLIKHYPQTWNPKSTKSKLAALVIAFFCSGALHASGSFTMWPSATRPLRGPFTFFALQPLGIALQMTVSALLTKTRILEKCNVPSWVCKLGNFVYVHVWFYLSAAFLADDFAGGGIWLFEPVPVSFVRGLGGQGWIWWDLRGMVRWWGGDGERWWRSGIAF